MGQGQTRRIGMVLLVGLVSLAVLIALLWLLESNLPDVEKYKDIADLVQTAITILALIGGAAFAAYKLELFRDFEPHLTISHNVNHRNIGESYVHLDVTVTLRNSSKVKVELRRGFLVLQRVSPASDEIAEKIYAEAFSHDNVEDFGWPVLEELFREWQRRELIIEPGESHNELLEFIISKEARTIQVYTFYRDPRFSDEDIGWSMATVYDIME